MGKRTRERREVVGAGRELLGLAQDALAAHAAAAARVRETAAAVTAGEVAAALERMPVDRLGEVSGGRLRLGALAQGGFGTVGAVARASLDALVRVPGIGRESALQAQAAAASLRRAAEAATVVRIEADHRTREADELISALFPFVDAGAALTSARDATAALVEELAPVVASAERAAGRVPLWLAGGRRRTETLDAVTELAVVLERAEGGARTSVAQLSSDLLRWAGTPDAAWWDFLTRSVEYYTALDALAEAGLTPDPAAAEGHLPDDLAGRVKAQPLDTSALRVTLRGYQEFGARYALAQRRALLGDEMGLGKTVQALAVLAHLTGAGETHHVVVCPAGVLVNWLREIEARSTLRAHRVHGPERLTARREWLADGGVAVTTFDGLRHLLPEGADGGAGRRAGGGLGVRLGAVVVDEAHLVKNPQAQRSQRVAALLRESGRALFLTGTPMENRVGEFRALVAHLQPELARELREEAGLPGADAFRRAVAPVYLRRNQADVLAELPETVEVDDWTEFSDADRAAYRAAVASGSFPAMHRAGYAAGHGSAKLARLLELVDEAAAAGEKVLVFSAYRDVLTAVERELAAVAAAGGPLAKRRRVFGPLHGGVAATARQDLVDAFTAHRGPAVLVAQIQAGGLGLNLQAANVVLLCEPQVKPALEQQAVARARRLGQTRRVRVHRLLSTEGVDQRLRRLVAGKEALFDAYARRSEAAEGSPEARDGSEAALAAAIVEEEQLRLAAGASGAAG